MDLSLEVEGQVASGNFEADCTIIDRVKKLSRRLRLTSDTLDDELLEVALTKTKNIDSSPIKPKQGKKPKAESTKPKPKTWTTNPQNQKKERSTQHEAQSTKPTNKPAPVEFNATSLEETHQTHNFSNDELLQNETVPAKASNENQQPEVLHVVLPLMSTTLRLASCEYIDLTLLQATCGAGLAADFDKAEDALHQSVFFDVTSGHTILAVHGPTSWQCCKGRKDRTEQVGCRTGRRCSSTSAASMPTSSHHSPSSPSL